MFLNVFVNCPVQQCEWWNKYESQEKATEALVLHCMGKHKIPEQLIRRYRRHWVNDNRAYRGWTLALDEIDKITGFRRRDSGLSIVSQKRMEAYLGLGDKR